MKKIILPLLLLAATLSSCIDTKKEKNAAETTDSLTVAPKDTLAFDSLTLHYDRQVIKNQETPKYVISLNADYAQGESELARRTNKLICHELFCTDSLMPREAMQHFADSIASQYEQDLREFYDPDDEDAAFRFTYEFMLEGHVDEHPHPKAQGYYQKIEAFQGGAHGSHLIYYFNINPETGMPVTYEDVFQENKNEQLLAMIAKQLLADYNYKTMEQLRDETSITLLGDLYVRDNFLIQDSGITFVYNTYDIAPYSAGTISVKLTFNQLADVLQPTFKPQKRI
jgi:hypothetical protein